MGSSESDACGFFCVHQTTDLTSVHLGVKFSCRFTFREIKERWYALLYDPVISK